MRMGVRIRTLVLAASLAAGGCAGSSTSSCLAGDPHCNSRSVDFGLQTVPPGWQPAAPIAVGSPVDVVIQEQRCVGSGSQSPQSGLGCGPFYVPATLHGVVVPLLSPSRCQVTVGQIAPGKVRVTRLAAGGDASIEPDPSSGVMVGGFCEIRVTDPTTSSVALEFYV